MHYVSPYDRQLLQQTLLQNLRQIVVDAQPGASSDIIEVRPGVYNEVQQKKKEAEITILHISGCFFCSCFCSV